MVNSKREKQASRGRSRLGCRSGFSLMEVLVVLAVMAIILMMALPSLYVLAPNYMVRSSAQGLAALMQRARLTANNTQKPTRVVLDCRADSQIIGTSSCLMMMFSANFDNTGELDARDPWRLAPDSRRVVDRRVRVGIPNVSGDTRPTPSPVYENIDGVYWAVFLPTGRVFISHDPMRLRFTARNDGIVGQREVSLNPFSGRAMVRNTQ